MSLTYEEIASLEEELKNLDLSDYLEGGAALAELQSKGFAPGDVLKKICEFYKKIRKFMVPITYIPFVGKAAKALMNILDTLCASN